MLLQAVRTRPTCSRSSVSAARDLSSRLGRRDRRRSSHGGRLVKHDGAGRLAERRQCRALPIGTRPSWNAATAGASRLVAETDMGGSIARAGVEAVGAAICRRSTADGGGVPQVPRPLGHGAARLVTGALSDGMRCIVCGTGVEVRMY